MLLVSLHYVQKFWGRRSKHFDVDLHDVLVTELWIFFHVLSQYVNLATTSSGYSKSNTVTDIYAPMEFLQFSMIVSREEIMYTGQCLERDFDSHKNVKMFIKTSSLFVKDRNVRGGFHCVKRLSMPSQGDANIQGSY